MVLLDPRPQEKSDRAEQKSELHVGNALEAGLFAG
jgi:hypothetical protein